VSRVRAFAHFWYDFVVGDDWRLALAAGAALGLCGLLSHHDVTSWWLVPSVVVVALTLTMIRMAPPAAPPSAPGATGSLGFPGNDQVTSIAEVDE